MTFAIGSSRYQAMAAGLMETPAINQVDGDIHGRGEECRVSHAKADKRNSCAPIVASMAPAIPCNGIRIQYPTCQYWQQNRPRCWRKNPPVADDMTRAPIGALVIFGLDAGSAFSLRSALRQAVGFAVHLQDVDVVGQAVEERAGEAFLAEGSGPLVERQVGCNDGGAALIALTD